MSLPLSLTRYLSDLNLTVPTLLDMSFVTSLQARHISRYSFNSLAVVMGEEISLELEDISKKIVESGLGGYCFEHNKLTFELLKSIGYDVTLKMARVLNNKDMETPRTHRITLLKNENVTYLVDTGFGGNCPITPLILQPDLVQTAGNDVYRIVAKASDEYDLQVVKEGSYYTLYRFDLAVYSDADCDVGHFFSHRYPKAGFVNNLMVGLKDADRTLFLTNHELVERCQNDVKTRVLSSPEDLHDVLTNTFEFTIELVVAEYLFDRFLSKKIAEQLEIQAQGTQS